MIKSFIEAPRIIDRGIAVLVRNETGKRGTLVTSIIYSNRNPSTAQYDCKYSEVVIWRNETLLNTRDLLVKWRGVVDKGFYTVKVGLILKDGTHYNSRLYGVLDNTNRLIIGLPHSIYPPLTIN